MAKLRVFDKVGLGEFIINAARDSAIRAAFVAAPKAALSKFVEIPADRTEKDNVIEHTIEVLEDSQDVTYIVLPWKDNVDRAMEKIEEQSSIYPTEYRPGSPDYIDDSKFPTKALFFRFGEYMFGRCK